MTILELLVVIAIIGMLSYLGYGAVRWLRGANVVEATTELASVMRRTEQLAAETGLMHRVVIDLDAQTYRVEVCEGGPGAISSKPLVAGASSDEERKRAVEDAKNRLASLPQGSLPAGSDPEQSEVMALALAGELGALRTCALSTALSGDTEGRELVRALDPNRSAKVTQVLVQHLEDPVTKGLVAIHFFPLGSAEKAIVEVGDGDKTFSILVHGLTGRVEVRDEPVRNPDEFLMRDATGERTEER